MKILQLFTQNQWQRKVLLTGLGLSWTMATWAISPPNHGEPDDKRKTKCDSEKTLNNQVAVVLNKKTNSPSQKIKPKKKQASAVLLPMVLPAKNLYY
jgi:hypothetical protein